LKLKLETEAKSLEASLQQLASPLTATEPLAGDEEARDEYLLACHAIGRVIGVQFKPHPGSRHGAPPKDPVGNIARASGVRVRQVILDGQWWRRDAGPMMALREADRRPVALLPVSPQRYDIYDPVTRARVRVNAATAQSL